MAIIFLTGHRGFIGGHLMRNLIEGGHYVDTDLRLLETCKYDCVIHLAGITHIKPDFDPMLYEGNIILSKKVMSTPYRTIYASSCSAAHLTNPYAYSKRYCEWLGEKHGNALGLRLHNVYGNGNNKGIVWYLMQQPDGATITIRGANLIRDYIHVDDVVDLIISKVKEYTDFPFSNGRISFEVGKDFRKRNVGVIDVGTGNGTSTLDLVKAYMKLSGKRFELNFVEAGENEPPEMISNNPVFATSLPEGLRKTIANA